MPLSEHEQRLLEQMERALYAEDPKFASSLRGKDPRSNFRRRVLLAGVGFIVGVVLLMTGLVAQRSLVSVIGFVLMLASAFFARHQLPRRHRRRPARRRRPQRGPPPAATGGGGRRQPAGRRPASWPGWKSAGTAAATRTAADARPARRSP